jgi:glycosyltransferase involved in cell wall biosynthesis
MKDEKFIRGWKTLPVPGRPRISVAVATFEQTDELACLLYSFRAQTYDHWEAIVVHDGPGPAGRAVVERIGDPRIVYVETESRRGSYGHPWRDRGIAACRGDYIFLTNGDNYYCPVFFEWMLHTLTTRNADLAFCDLVHSHAQWAPLRCGPAKGMVDLGCYVARAALMKTTPFADHGFFGDGVYFEELRRKANMVIHVPKALFVHN